MDESSTPINSNSESECTFKPQWIHNWSSPPLIATFRVNCRALCKQNSPCALYMWCAHVGRFTSSSKLLGQLVHSWSQFAFTLHFVEYNLANYVLPCALHPYLSLREKTRQTMNRILLNSWPKQNNSLHAALLRLPLPTMLDGVAHFLVHLGLVYSFNLCQTNKLQLN